MFTKRFEINDQTKLSAPQEGDLFKVIAYMGRQFEIRYGYYEEKDRKFEPIPIYPDFYETPVYTDDGTPFATAIQHPCKWFKGRKDENSTCEECACYQKCEELLGICTSSHNKKPADGKVKMPAKGVHIRYEKDF